MSCLDDIEDIANNGETLSNQRAPRKRVIPKKLTTQLRHEVPVAESVIPGTQSVSSDHLRILFVDLIKGV